MKNHKQLLALALAAVLLCMGMLTACGDPSTDDPSDGSHHVSQGTQAGGNDTDDPIPDENTDGGSETGGSEALPPEAEIYAEYPDVLSISPFSNGVASFAVVGGSYYGASLIVGGYIDMDGNIIVKPEYDIGHDDAYFSLPAATHSCIKLKDLSTYGVKADDAPERIVDLKGNILFEVGRDKVEHIGDISNGYFWVQTLEGETVAGNICKTVYYSADTLKPVAEFENHMAKLKTSSGSYSTDSDVAADGQIKLFTGENTKTTLFNIGDYDSTFVPQDEDTAFTWNDLDLSGIPEFSGAEYMEAIANDNEQYSVVIIRNSSRVYFYSIIDRSGNVTMTPQKDLPLSKTAYIQCGLCPVQDPESELWGYTDTTGKWVIDPQYSSVSSFSKDGYATVNKTTIIDTTGQVVLAPASWYAEAVTALSGKFRYAGEYSSSWGNASFSLEFTEEGEIQCYQYLQALGSSDYIGTYEINGKNITISVKFDALSFIPFEAGIHSFTFDGTTLVIDGSPWTLVVEDDE